MHIPISHIGSHPVGVAAWTFMHFPCMCARGYVRACLRACVHACECANSKGSGETSCFQYLVTEFLLLAYSMSNKNILYELPHFYQMGQIVRISYLSPRRVANAQPSLRIFTDSTEPFMLTYKCTYLGILALTKCWN